ncbi:MAG: iron-containing redox enzyme family protein [Actinomycetia bacterium]|nr:iron-containing redox enzyme family protein [Actinomycetes bacterium]
MSVAFELTNTSGRSVKLADAFAEEFVGWLARPADEVDAEYVDGGRLLDLVGSAAALGERARRGDQAAAFTQQYLLGKLYELSMQLPSTPNAEGSVAVQALVRQLEKDTVRDQDSYIDHELISASPESPDEFVSWLKSLIRSHRVFKHPYWHEFMRNEATPADLRHFVLQESSVDARFDDLLALMQVGTDGATKMEIASNYWDEMGNGQPEQVHTVLFQHIIDHFEITDQELKENLSTSALLGGNLAVLVCRYRSFFSEAVGHLAVAEWLAPDRFAQVLHAWRRLDLPPKGIIYHELHIGIDAHHASAWFAHVVKPLAGDPAARRAIARGALWRADSSARYLDGILDESR